MGPAKMAPAVPERDAKITLEQRHAHRLEEEEAPKGLSSRTAFLGRPNASS